MISARLVAAEQALDAASASVDAALAALREQVARYVAQPKTRRAVLIVEDDLASVRALKKVLGQIHDLDVEAADTCDEAERILANASLPPRVVLLDINLPGRPGYKLAEKLPRVVHVILMSGAIVGEALSALAGVTVAGYMDKPIDFDDLLGLVRRALGDDA